MTEVIKAVEGRGRHWFIDAVVGGGVALGLIGMAQAALPERAEAPPAAPPARTAPSPAASAEPVTLIAFRDPIAGEEVVSPFGLRRLPWEEQGRLHEGVDIAADFGEPVLTAADGVVTRAGQSTTYGRFVEVKHAEGLTTLYAHMGQVAAGLRAGDAVKAGTPVGQVGSSGTSTGPHLHFEIRDARNRPLNPAMFLGRRFAEADELPLRAARRVPKGVRVAFVSQIPASKKAQMAEKLQARLDAQARSATELGQEASATVASGDGRPRATFRFQAPPAPDAMPIDTGAKSEAFPVDLS